MPDIITIAAFDEGSPLRCAMRRLGIVGTHSHDVFEIDLILSGSCHVTQGTDVFTAAEEDIFSIDPNVPHSFAGSDCTLVTIQFDQHFFERTLPNPVHPEFFCNSVKEPFSPAYDQLKRLIALLIRNNADRQRGYELRNWSYIYQIMDVMYQHFMVEDSEKKGSRLHRYTARVEEIRRIISEHYQEPFTLSDLAEQVHLTPPYLSRFFEQQFGENFLEYLTKIRLSHAYRALIESQDNIETIALDSGFSGSHAFVQAFRKEYGMLPSAYRRKIRQDATRESASLLPEQHEYLTGLRKYLETEKSGPIRSIDRRIRLSALSEGTKLVHNWKRMTGVSSASSLLLSDIQQLLARVQDEIGFTYIKFNGILSDDIHILSEDRFGDPVYSFTYADKVFDFLMSLHLKPLVQLSFMPSQLAKTNKRVFGYLVSEPADIGAWTDLVKALIHHLIERYGREEVHTWMFSVWEQPDTPEALYGFPDPSFFYTFFEQTWQAVKQIDPDLSFGMPSTYYICREGYTNWYLPFMAWCRSHRCMPDFLNFHYYDTVLVEQTEPADPLLENSAKAFGFPIRMQLREDADGLGQFVEEVRKERPKLSRKELPIYLTEWNTTPSQEDLLNDTCYKSCYLIKGILENYDLLDSFTYWSLCDWMGEAPEPDTLFFGGLGLFTTSGIPKASYYALTLLRSLGSELIGRGDGWFVTRGHEGYQIFLYNYKHFSRLYAMGERFDMTPTDRYTPFYPEQTLSFELELTDLQEGSYLITETVINRKSGSSFDLWVDMGAQELTKKAELDNLAARSAPAIHKSVVRCENGSLRLQFQLDMLEVRMISIDKN